MTTGESIDNMENVTITSDEAFERVTSDEHFEEDKRDGYLKQNTSGLVQEIPNISFVDIADTMLESKKTLYDRAGWNVVVGMHGKSIELQPQDIARLMYSEEKYEPTATTYRVPFNQVIQQPNNTTFSVENGEVIIGVDGTYRVSYGWMVDTGYATDFQIGLYKNRLQFVTSDRYKQSSTLGYLRLSGGRTISLDLKKGDTLCLQVNADANITALYGETNTYLEVQYARQPIA